MVHKKKKKKISWSPLHNVIDEKNKNKKIFNTNTLRDSHDVIKPYYPSTAIYDL